MKITKYSFFATTLLTFVLWGTPAAGAQENSFASSSAHRLHQANANLPQWILDKRPNGCMATLNQSLQAIFDWDQSRRVEFRKSVYKRSSGSPNVNAAMRQLRHDGLLSDIYRIRYSSSENTYVASVEQTVVNLAKKQAGIHYFALAVNGGRHAVLLGVLKSKKTGNWEVYWFDQNTQGFSESNRLTGQLDTWVTSDRFEYATAWKWTHIELGHLTPQK